MRETLISAGGRAPHQATYDTTDVVESYRRRRAQRRALLGAPSARTAHPAGREAPPAPGTSPRHRAPAC
jgi:hypothetical protein